MKTGKQVYTVDTVSLAYLFTLSTLPTVYFPSKLKEAKQPCSKS